MRKAFLVFGIVIIVLAIYLGTQNQTVTETDQKSSFEMLNNPDLYDNKIVVVEGVEICKFEGNCLWPSRIWSEIGGLWNCLKICIDTDNKNWEKFVRYSGKYVRITGVFSKDCLHQGGLGKGGIREIMKIELLPEPARPPNRTGVKVEDN